MRFCWLKKRKSWRFNYKDWSNCGKDKVLEAEELLKKIDHQKIPRHVAIIMDGNGRWAKSHNLPRVMGHGEGAKRVRDIVLAAKEIGVKVLTLYAFSTENWIRPKTEIKSLMKLLVMFLKKELRELKKDNIKLIYSGDISVFPEGVRDTVLNTMEETKSNKKMILNLALNYGSRDEIIRAVNNILTERLRSSAGFAKMTGPVTREIFSEYLYTAGLPDPDLLIRTSGEKRMSNFLLWQIAYAELYFTSVLWPDFNRGYFLEAILDYQQRKRRFGGVS
jgi:undecaprenyl diphosphate synthase